MGHIFISYSTHNSEYASRLAKRLRAKGFDVWIDNTRLRSGVDWWRSIVLAIDACAAFVVILTPESDRSKWVQREITLADQRDKPIFPLLLAGDINTPNWSMFVRTQYEDVRNGHLPDSHFFANLAKYAPQRSRGKDVTMPALADPVEMDTAVRQAIADPPELEEATKLRYLEAAMPACTKLNNSTLVKVKITLPGSKGLREELPEALPSGDIVQQGDVSASSFALKFKRDPRTGQLLPGTLCVSVIADDFDVQNEQSEQRICAESQRELECLPDHDSRTLNFVLLPRSNMASGASAVCISVSYDGRKVAEMSLVTQLVADLNEHPICGKWCWEQKLLELQIAPLRQHAGAELIKKLTVSILKNTKNTGRLGTALVTFLPLVLAFLALTSDEWRNDAFYKLGMYTATPDLTATSESVAIATTLTLTAQPTYSATLTITPLRTPNPWGITLPKTFESVPAAFTASGTYDANQLGDGELWIFIKPINGEYYPQLNCSNPPGTAIAVNSAEETWEVSVDLSVMPADSSRIIELTLSRTAMPRKKDFVDYIQSWCNRQTTQGLAFFKNYDLYEVASTTVRYEG